MIFDGGLRLEGTILKIAYNFRMIYSESVIIKFNSHKFLLIIMRVLVIVLGIVLLICCVSCNFIIVNQAWMEVGSFDIFPVTLISPEVEQVLIIPNINKECQLQVEADSYDGQHNLTAIVIVSQPHCKDATEPLKLFDNYSKFMIQKGYPPIKTVLWSSIDGVRMPLGSPESSLPPALTFTKLNLTYQIIESPIKLTRLSSIIVINKGNPWSQLINAPNHFTWTVAFQVLKFLLAMTQIILCAFVAARSMFKSHLQIGLLAVGFLQLGGELILTWANASYLSIKLYSATMLLPACIVNSLVVLSWCNMVWRLRTSVKVAKFRSGVQLESVALMLAISLMMMLLIFSHFWIGINSQWFNNLIIISLLSITIIPCGMGGWFFYQARQFCPIFHATAKLINAQWFTLFILFTRMFFIFDLVSYHLVILHVTNPHQYLSFGIMNSIASVTYNVMIIATVLKMQSIHAVQHRWTPEQLGLVTLEDGSVIAIETNSSNDSDQTQSPFITSQRRPTTLTTNPFEKRLN